MISGTVKPIVVASASGSSTIPWKVSAIALSPTTARATCAGSRCVATLVMPGPLAMTADTSSAAPNWRKNRISTTLAPACSASLMLAFIAAKNTTDSRRRPIAGRMRSFMPGL